MPIAFSSSEPELADGGLRQVERLGGAGEVLQLVHGAEGPELAQRDTHGATPARGGYRTQAARASVFIPFQTYFMKITRLL